MRIPSFEGVKKFKEFLPGWFQSTSFLAPIAVKILFLKKRLQRKAGNSFLKICFKIKRDS